MRVASPLVAIQILPQLRVEPAFFLAVTEDGNHYFTSCQRLSKHCVPAVMISPLAALLFSGF